MRQPFRFAFDPDASGTRFFINDVGKPVGGGRPGREGADYGWNLCEGNHDNPGRAGSVNCAAAPYTPPIHEYSHDTGCSSITGGAFVPNGFWPARYDNSYLYGDYVCNKIFELKPRSGGGFRRPSSRAGWSGRAFAMAFGPDGSGQALYYTTYANGGEVRRITYVQGPTARPHAAVSASPSTETCRSTSASTAPGAPTRTRGRADGLPLGLRRRLSSSRDYDLVRQSHLHGAGTYTATLTVRDESGAEDTATVRVDAGNRPPEPTISSPTQDQLFKVGEKIVLRGSATDPEDGQLADDALSWQVVQHHAGDHTHPFLPPTPGNDVEIVAPAPEDIHSTDPEGNYLEIRLTATDSKGLSTTVIRKLAPDTVDVVSNPDRPSSI